MLLAACAARGPVDVEAPAAAEREMVVTAHPLATAAGMRVLEAGGNAVDAMVTVQAVLGLVEPEASGLGGGAFAVYHDASTGTTTSFDARETAPAAATPERFLDEEGEPLGFDRGWQSGRSVGVPGVPRLLEVMHARYGALPWADLFEPAIEIARRGFSFTGSTEYETAKLLAKNPSCEPGERLFFRDPAAFAYLVDADSCTAKPAGTRVRNPDYATTLEALARGGADAFYRGAIASDIVAAVRRDSHMPGDMTLDDLAGYRVIEREPVCAPYRGRRVCGMGPPSSGALAVGQMLGIMEARSDLAGEGPLDPRTVHLFTQAGRLAFADRNRYLGDSDFVAVPVAGLLDPGYLAARAALITGIDMGTAEPGVPPGVVDPGAPHHRAKPGGTSHFSILDRHGNALSVTATIESAHGNGVMVRGFLLNNELTDFSFSPADADGRPVANRVEPGKRPRSSMAPTIVFDADGRVELITGSAGGSRIIAYAAQSIVNILDFGLDAQAAVKVPHFMNRNGRTDLEAPAPGVTLDYDLEALQRDLEGRGHEVGVARQNSGLSVIRVVHREDGPARLLGGADRRRNGTVAGR